MHRDRPMQIVQGVMRNDTRHYAKLERHDLEKLGNDLRGMEIQEANASTTIVRAAVGPTTVNHTTGATVTPNSHRDNTADLLEVDAVSGQILDG